MKVTPAEVETCLQLLEATPRMIARATKEADGTRLQYKPDKRIWSINDILAHLRSCADVWGSSIDSMLIEDTPTLPDIHPRVWIKETDYLELPFHESFQAFTKQRDRLLITLKKLSFHDWSRAAMIGGRKHTIFTQARRMAKHEKEHCEQIENLLQNPSWR